MNNSNIKKPYSNCFASGPVNKILKWELANNSTKDNYLSLLGRSHRSKEFLKFTQDIIYKIKSLLNIPKNYKIVTLTGGATGAVEMAMWNLLGPKPLDCLSWEFFGNIWYENSVYQLKLPKVYLHKANFGSYPNLDKVNFEKNDLLFVYSGSTSGVIFKDEDKLSLNREGIVISDATSYLFMYNVPWEKLDAVAFSWQKVLAGEAAHGMLVLSPKAIERLKNYNPSWPIPKLFNLKDKNGVLIDEFFDKGICLNTPSALAFIDLNYNLDWIIGNGGIGFLQERVNNNYEIIKNWVKQTPWIDFLVKDERYRSKCIACLVINDDKWNKLNLEQRKSSLKYIIEYLDGIQIAKDISMYRLAPISGFRIWIGPTILENDIVLLTHWLDDAYNKMKEKFYN